MLAPVILPAKQILQTLTGLRLGWDESIPEEHLKKWTSWVNDLYLLRDYKVKRCIKPHDFGHPVSAQLHHFGDASESGYGTVSYLRMVNKANTVCCSFIIGKARVAPLKPLTIPRMELTAATVAVRIDRMMQEEMELSLEPSVFWTDSTSLLKYINNETSRFTTFVANRVAVIRSASEDSQWRYVNGYMNPADCVSRGITASRFMRDEVWLSGPEFLRLPEPQWPKVPELRLTASDPDVKVLAVTVTTKEDCTDTVNKLLTYYSQWHRLKRAVAWMLRFKAWLNARKNTGLDKKEIKCDKGSLSDENLQEAENAIIQFCQSVSFREELTALKKGLLVKKISHLYKLSSILQNNLIRLGSRLSKSAVPSEAKHPAILPTNHHATLLLIRYVHENIGHSGRNYTHSRLRQKYWIPSRNAAIRKVISKCVTCKRLSGLKGERFMADLYIVFGANKENFCFATV